MNMHVGNAKVKDDALALIRRDLKKAAPSLGRKEVAFMVKMYYSFQKDRIVANNRMKAVTKTNGTGPVCLGMFTQYFEQFEKTMIVPLKEFVENDPVGQWLISQKGIGPVIAAGFLSFLDIERANSASHFISYAGLDPSLDWSTQDKQWRRTHTKHNTVTGGRDVTGIELLGRKRPFNLELKTLCFKFSKSIVMVGGGELYRDEIYNKRKLLENQRNDSGAYREIAHRLLERINKGDIADLVRDHDNEEASAEEKEAEIKSYKSTLIKGKLVPAHIDARARRHLSTIFLNHLFVVMYENAYKRAAPLPYVQQHLGHVDIINPPKYDSPYR